MNVAKGALIFEKTKFRLIYECVTLNLRKKEQKSIKVDSLIRLVSTRRNSNRIQFLKYFCEKIFFRN